MEKGIPKKWRCAGDAQGRVGARKKTSGYHRRSLAETGIYRLKLLLAGKISLRNYNCQTGEVMRI